MVLSRALAAAARMGTRAGEAFRQSGIPTPNPMPSSQPQLAQAWRAAYFKAAGTPR